MKGEYIIYEYISVNAKKDLEQTYIDCYKNFGWIHTNNEKRDYYINSNTNPNEVEINFKRNINVNNKDELNQLQIKCEKAFLMIDKLKKQPQSLATRNSLMVGFVTLVLITLSVFSIINDMWFIGVLCGIIGTVSCIFPYFIYKRTITSKEIENETKISEQYEIISKVYGQARKILLQDE